MRKMKIALLLVALFAFSSELFAENSNKVVYGSEEEDSIIRQSDINKLIEEWNSPQIISLVWVLYNILDDNEEWVDLDSFKEMVNLQTSKWITIEYLDDLWIWEKTMNTIKINDYLIKWLWIDINWKTSWEKLVLLDKKQQSVTAERIKLWKVAFANRNK